MSRLFRKPKKAQPKQEKEAWEVEKEKITKQEQEYIEAEQDKLKETLLLSPKQFELLDYIRKNPYKKQKEYAAAIGIQQSNVAHHLKQILKNNPQLRHEIKSLDRRQGLSPRKIWKK